MPRDSDRSHLHSDLAEKLVALDSALASKGIPLQLFEGARSPNRQVELYSYGRGTGAPGFAAGAWLHLIDSPRTPADVLEAVKASVALAKSVQDAKR